MFRIFLIEDGKAKCVRTCRKEETLIRFLSETIGETEFKFIDNVCLLKKGGKMFMITYGE